MAKQTRLFINFCSESQIIVIFSVPSSDHEELARRMAPTTDAEINAFYVRGEGRSSSHFRELENHILQALMIFANYL